MPRPPSQSPRARSQPKPGKRENINDPELLRDLGRGRGGRSGVLDFEQSCAKPSNRERRPAPNRGADELRPEEVAEPVVALAPVHERVQGMLVAVRRQGGCALVDGRIPE